MNKDQLLNHLLTTMPAEELAVLIEMYRQFRSVNGLLRVDILANRQYGGLVRLIHAVEQESGQEYKALMPDDFDLGPTIPISGYFLRYIRFTRGLADEHFRQLLESSQRTM